jgi:hypothetical protein
MLSALPTTQSDPILDLPTDNWSIFTQAFTQLCFTKFGVAGQQILSDRVIPLVPFPTAPSKNALDTDADGLPIPDQYIYSRRRFTLDESALPTFSLANLTLSDSGNREYRDDLKIFTAAARRSSDDDTECLEYLYKHVSATSHTSIKTHKDYAAYQLLPIGTRSYPFYKMARDIHSVGNATTKLHRTRLYVNVAQNDMSHEAYIELITSMADTFTLDFESTEHPGYVSLNELRSSLYLNGLNKTQFRRAVDEILQSNPTGRFPDPGALMTKLQAWKIANSLSFPQDPVSMQGSALISSKPSVPQPPNTGRSKQTPKKDSAQRTPHLHPTPCTWCLAADNASRYGHLSSHCSKNPNRISGPSPVPTIPTSTPSRPSSSTTSSRLHALLNQLDVASSPTASNAAMLLIAEAAIEASEYTDIA